jgi:predicted O-linked N-acetylglucosamine transferase (SPINDLY family)
MRGRVSAGMYRMMGIDDCIAVSLESYVEIALKLGTDETYRAEISIKIQESRDVLFNDTSVVSEFEAFFKNAMSKS